jgi:5-formyltetrahydrofolate cyclo-ligase
MLEKIILDCKNFVGYTPLIGDLDYTSMPMLKNLSKNILLLPNNKDSDPLIWADKCRALFYNESTIILIPGQRFDIYGTRHGRGGGWYDRFLSAVPKEWVRIGFINNNKLFMSPLPRQEWDELVDWVIVKNKTSWKIYETKAR